MPFAEVDWTMVQYARMARAGARETPEYAKSLAANLAANNVNDPRDSANACRHKCAAKLLHGSPVVSRAAVRDYAIT
jgi:hypothetical protein